MTDDLHPLLQGRFSPLSFDPGHQLSPAQVDLLLEAARWAPSAGNSQPWAFVTARRGDKTWNTIVARLAPSARRWALDASLLVVNVAHTHVEDSDLEYSEFSAYDLGQAVAHLTLEASALGLACRQFRAFDLDGLASDLAIARGWQILTMTAIGVAGPERSSRERRTIAELRDDAVER